jgi:hypothetical protein
MKKDFIEFNKYITIDKKNKTAKYEDNEGNYAIYDIRALICKCENVTFDKQELIIAKFQQIVPQDIILPKKTITTIMIAPFAIGSNISLN